LYKRDQSGPFLLGSRASYADCIVGGWLRMMGNTLPGEEWEALRHWHDGTFGRLHDALDRFAEVK
jgi:glutathione S-transferase